MNGMNWHGGLGLLGAGVLFFASFSSSPTYQLKSYSVGPGGTSNSSSTTYHVNGTLGEQTNGSTASPNNTAGNGSVQTFQLNLPSAPTLGNGSGTYYNRLSFIINTANEPSDATYAVEVSTASNFSSNVTYVQADGTQNTTPVYQSYATWGGSSGSIMTGLATSTTYYVAEIAMEGMFTNTEHGASSSIATVAPSITFSVSPNSINMGNLTTGSVVTSSNVTFSLATNANFGGNVYVYGLNSGLKSSTLNSTITAFTGSLGSTSQGFGVQATGPTQTSGGPLSTVSPFNGTSNTVGGESAVPQRMLTTSNPIVGGAANANMQAKISTTTPAASDYSETLSFIAATAF
jgi:hypothetical protein